MRIFMNFQIVSLMVIDALLIGHWSIYHDLINLIIYFMLACAFFGVIQFLSALIIFSDEDYRIPELRSYIVASCLLIGIFIPLAQNQQAREAHENWLFFLMPVCYLTAHLYPAVLYRMIRHIKINKSGIGL